MKVNLNSLRTAQANYKLWVSERTFFFLIYISATKKPKYLYCRKGQTLNSWPIMSHCCLGQFKLFSKVASTSDICTATKSQELSKCVQGERPCISNIGENRAQQLGRATDTTTNLTNNGFIDGMDKWLAQSIAYVCTLLYTRLTQCTQKTLTS